LVGLNDSIRELDFLLGLFKRLLKEFVDCFVGGLVAAFDENPDDGLTLKEVVFDAMAKGRVENALESGLISWEDKWARIVPTFRGVEEEGWVGLNFFEPHNGKLLVGFEFVEVEDFKSEIEGTAGRSEFGLEVEEILFEVGWRGTLGDELEPELIGLPSFKCVSEDRDLAGEGLDRKHKEEKEPHGVGSSCEGLT